MKIEWKIQPRNSYETREKCVIDDLWTCQKQFK